MAVMAGLPKRWSVRLRSARVRLLGQRARKFFRFEYTWIAVPFLYPLGWGMVALGDQEHASDSVFIAAYAMFVSAIVWLIGSWLTSDFLARRNPTGWSNQQKKRVNLKAALPWYLFWTVSAPAVLILVLCTSLWETSIIRYNKEMSSLEGTLYPANEPTPRPCNANPGKYTVYFPQTNLAVAADRLPLPLFINKKSGLTIAQLVKNSDDTLGISMDIRSDDQKIIVRLANNEYLVNHNNYLQISRRNDKHDRSTLSVTDQDGKEVLQIKYLNANAFTVTADLKIDGRELDTSKLGVRNGCLTNNHGPEGAGVLAF